MKRLSIPLLTKLQVSRKLSDEAPDLPGHLKRAWVDDLEKTLVQAMEAPIEARLAPGVSVLLDLSLVLRRQLAMDHRGVTWTVEPIEFALREAVRKPFSRAFAPSLRRPLARVMLALAWLTGGYDRFREGAEARALEAAMGLITHHLLSMVRIRVEVLNEMGDLGETVEKIRDLLLATLVPASAPLSPGEMADGA